MRTEAIQTWPALIVQVSLLELLFTSCWAAEERRGGGGGVCVRKGSFQLLNPLVVLNSNQVPPILPARNAKRRKAAESKENQDWEGSREYESGTRWVYLMDLLLVCVSLC